MLNNICSESMSAARMCLYSMVVGVHVLYIGEMRVGNQVQIPVHV